MRLKRRSVGKGVYYSVEYVKWRRVNEYLQEFGFSPEVAKTTADGYFIPESAFYLLAMKASNEAAKNFQLLIATEILPTLRATGTAVIKSFGMNASSTN